MNRLASLLALFACGCVGDSTVPPVDGGMDTTNDTSVADVASDVSVDTGVDAGPFDPSVRPRLVASGG